MKVNLLLSASICIGCIIPLFGLTQSQSAFVKTPVHVDRRHQPKEDSNISLKEALIRIKEKFKVDILFDAGAVNGLYVSLDEVNSKFSTIEEALKSILRAKKLIYRRLKKDTYIIISKGDKAKQTRATSNTLQVEEPGRIAGIIHQAEDQNKKITDSNISFETSISGRVVNENGSPVSGASVMIKGSNKGTTTDMAGRFTIEVKDEKEVLVISYVGYEPYEIEVGNRTSIEILLRSTSSVLSDVVVVGYGTQRRGSITSAISSVKGKDLENIPLASVDNLLQGRAAGVQVSQSSGQPGGALTVRIRGNTSVQGGNDPLYVVDGVLIQSITVDRLADGGAGTNPLADINPSDIESIEILKDAAATSIYGARAANGVVLITTKKGKTGAPSIKFNAYYGVQEVTRKLSQINARQYRDYVKEAWANAGRDIRTGDPIQALDSFNFNKDFYWQDALFQRAPMSNYDLSVGGGQEKISYYLSGAYFNQEGIMRNSKFDRITTRANVEYKASRKFKLGNTFTFSHSRSNRVSESNIDSRGVLFRTLSRMPTDAPYDDQGNLRPNNPITTLLASYQKTGSNRVIGSLYGELEVVKNLFFRSSVALDYLSFKEDRFFPSIIFSFGGVQRSGASQLTELFNWINENTATYTRELGNQHRFVGLVGFSQQKNNSASIGGHGSKYSTDLIPTLNAAAQRDNLFTNETAYSLLSYYARINYDYAGKYILSMTGRYDGSSRFGSNNRYGFFPSASLGWRVSEEDFMKRQDFINDLKIRGSIGKTGNQTIGNFASRGALAIGADYNGSGGVVPAQNGLPNPDLSWESTTQSDIGMDISFMKNRITVVADVYYKKTNDLLFNRVIPTQSGYSSIAVNLGSIENKGVEFELSTRNLVGKLKWNTSFNIGFNRNKVLSLPGNADIITARSILRVGQPIGSFFGFKQLGVFASDGDNSKQMRFNTPTGFAFAGGDVHFFDANGDNVINNTDRIILGNPNPDFIGGLSNNFSYQGFDLVVFVNFSKGNDIFNELRRDRDSHRLGTGAGASTDVLRRWRKQGDITDFPRVFVGDSRQNGRFNSSYWMEDGSFIRLKNVSVGYNIPSDVTRKISLASARIYVTGQNLITLTKYKGFDPETVNNSSNANGNSLEYGVDFGYYPIARSLVFGINLGF